jgi:tRNA(fMet)-specific endonuclease VapC
MNGTRYLLDTNAVIAIVKGNSKLLARLNAATYVSFSIISVIEFMAFSNLSKEDKAVFEEMLAEANVIDLDYADKNLLNSIVAIRQTYKLKLPDAIIAATALTYNCQLVSNDKNIIKVPQLSIISF